MSTSSTPGERERARRQERRFAAARLFEQDMPSPLIAERLGVSPQAVDQWKAMWKRGGLTALSSSGRPGSQGLLDAEQRAVLLSELRRGPRAHGYERDKWTLRQVNVLIDSLFGVCFADESGVWRLLRRIGASGSRTGPGTRP